MEQIVSSTPGLFWRGTLDKSGGASNINSTPLPFVAPLVFFFSPSGKEGFSWIRASELENSYGAKAFSFDSEYATHATAYLDVARRFGSWIEAYRLRPEDAPDPAAIGLSIEFVKDEMDQYEVDVDGNWVLDADGNRKPTGTKVTKLRIRFVKEELERTDGKIVMGGRVEREGDLTASNGDVSRRIPFLDFAATDFGSDGNNIACRLWAPTSLTGIKADADLNEEVNAFVYRFQLMKRASVTASPAIYVDSWDRTSISVSFGENVVSTEDGGVVLDIDSRIPGSWEDSSGDTVLRSPLQQPHVYRTLLTELLKEIQAVEAANGTVEMGDDALNLINFISAQTVDGLPYQNVEIEGMTDGSLVLNENSLFYLAGGGDGTMGNDSLNTLVGKIFGNMDQPGIRLTSIAKHPSNFFVDSGYNLDTKYQLGQYMYQRPDAYVLFATQDVTRAPNDDESEESIATAIYTRMQQYPDSIEYSTAPYRAAIVGHCGQYTGTKSKFLVPLSIDLAAKLIRYGSSETGALVSDWAPDTSDEKITAGIPNYVVTEVKNLNNLDKSWRTKRRQWAASLVYVEDYDHNARQFYPGMQSIYGDETSALNSLLAGLCSAKLARVSWEVWRQFTGNQRLTKDQYLERSEKYAAAKIAGMMDNRGIFIPTALSTALDEARGYSWSMRWDVGYNVMKTVLTSWIVAYRREELENGA